MLPQKITFSNPGGFPLSQDTLAYMQRSYEMICDALTGSMGKSVTAILAGVEWNGSVWTEGLVVHNNKLVYFGESGATPDDALVVETDTQGETYNDGNYHECYTEVTAYAGTETDFYLKNLPRINWKALNDSISALAASVNVQINEIKENLNLIENVNNESGAGNYSLTFKKLNTNWLISGWIKLYLTLTPSGSIQFALPDNSITKGQSKVSCSGLAVFYQRDGSTAPDDRLYVPYTLSLENGVITINYETAGISANSFPNLYLDLSKILI